MKKSIILTIKYDYSYYMRLNYDNRISLNAKMTTLLIEFIYVHVYIFSEEVA